MLSTNVFAIEDALLELISPVVTALGAACDLGVPGRRQERHVWITGDHDVTQSYPVSGICGATAERQEDGDSTIKVFARGAVKDYAEIRDVAAEIAGEIESSIADDPTLSGMVDSLLVTAISTADFFVDEKRRACGIQLTVHHSGVVRVTADPVS